MSLISQSKETDCLYIGSVRISNLGSVELPR